MKALITTLERLRSIKNKNVSVLTVKLSQQKEICLRHENNIKTLNFLLSRSAMPTQVLSANLLKNHADYKKSITRVIDWQKQEYALVQNKVASTKSLLLNEARKEKVLEMVVEDNRNVMVIEENRYQQRNMDSLAIQCWLRKNRIR